MTVLSLFFDPASAVLEARQNRKLSISIVLLLVAALLLAISSGVTTAVRSMAYGVDAVSVVMNTALTFIYVFLGAFFIGYLVGLVMRTLGATGGFFEGFTTTVYAAFVPCMAIFVTGLLSLGASFAGSGLVSQIIWGFVSVISTALTLWAFALGLATLYRALKELFSTDSVTALVAMFIVGVIALILTIQNLVAMIFANIYAY